MPKICIVKLGTKIIYFSKIILNLNYIQIFIIQFKMNIMVINIVQKNLKMENITCKI